MSDTLTTIYEDTQATSGTSGAGGSSGGLDQTTADARYARQSNNGSDFDSASAVRSNIGLANASADLDLNSISVNGTNLFPSDDPQALGTSDSPTFAGATITGRIDITDDATTHEGMFIINSAAASTSNISALQLRGKTDAQERTYLRIAASFNDISDATRNSEILFQAFNSGSFETFMKLVNENVHANDFVLT